MTAISSVSAPATNPNAQTTDEAIVQRGADTVRVTLGNLLGKFDTVTTVPTANDGNDGDVRLLESTGAFYKKAGGVWSVVYTISSAGSNGWTPTLALQTDNARLVIAVVSWSGGQGTAPAAPVYLGATGLVSAIADAVDVKGAAGSAGAPGTQFRSYANVNPPNADGVDGDLAFRTDTNGLFQKVSGAYTLIATLGNPTLRGWTPNLRIVSDGQDPLTQRSVLQVISWTGGDGAMPPTGGYVGRGGYTNNIAEAENIRGARGETGPAGQRGEGVAGPAGAAGAAGAAGPAGQDGSTVRRGTENPESTLGNDGDYYINTASGEVFEKVSGAWESVIVWATAALNFSGWTPRIGVQSDGTRRVLNISSWEGGTGNPPATGYVGESGLVDDVQFAVDIRGEPGAGGQGGGTGIVEIFSDASLTGQGTSDSRLGIADDGVQAQHIRSGAINSLKIAPLAVGNAAIDNNTIQVGKLNATGGRRGQVLKIDHNGNVRWLDEATGTPIFLRNETNDITFTVSEGEEFAGMQIYNGGSTNFVDNRLLILRKLTQGVNTTNRILRRNGVGDGNFTTALELPIASIPEPSHFAIANERIRGGSYIYPRAGTTLTGTGERNWHGIGGFILDNTNNRVYPIAISLSGIESQGLDNRTLSTTTTDFIGSQALLTTGNYTGLFTANVSTGSNGTVSGFVYAIQDNGTALRASFTFGLDDSEQIVKPSFALGTFTQTDDFALTGTQEFTGGMELSRYLFLLNDTRDEIDTYETDDYATFSRDTSLVFSIPSGNWQSIDNDNANNVYLLDAGTAPKLIAYGNIESADGFNSAVLDASSDLAFTRASGANPVTLPIGDRFISASVNNAKTEITLTRANNSNPVVLSYAGSEYVSATASGGTITFTKKDGTTDPVDVSGEAFVGLTPSGANFTFTRANGTNPVTLSLGAALNNLTINDAGVLSWTTVGGASSSVDVSGADFTNFTLGDDGRTITLTRRNGTTVSHTITATTAGSVVTSSIVDGAVTPPKVAATTDGVDGELLTKGADENDFVYRKHTATDTQFDAATRDNTIPPSVKQAKDYTDENRFFQRLTFTNGALDNDLEDFDGDEFVLKGLESIGTNISIPIGESNPLVITGGGSFSRALHGFVDEDNNRTTTISVSGTRRAMIWRNGELRLYADGVRTGTYRFYLLSSNAVVTPPTFTKAFTSTGNAPTNLIYIRGDVMFVPDVYVPDGTVTDAKLSGQIAASRIPADAIDNSKLADDAVQSENILNGAVTTTKVLDGNITKVKLADDVIDASKIDANNEPQTGQLLAKAAVGDEVEWVTGGSGGGAGTVANVRFPLVGDGSVATPLTAAGVHGEVDFNASFAVDLSSYNLASNSFGLVAVNSTRFFIVGINNNGHDVIVPVSKTDGSVSASEVLTLNPAVFFPTATSFAAFATDTAFFVRNTQPDGFFAFSISDSNVLARNAAADFTLSGINQFSASALVGDNLYIGCRQTSPVEYQIRRYVFSTKTLAETITLGTTATNRVNSGGVFGDYFYHSTVADAVATYIGASTFGKGRVQAARSFAKSTGLFCVDGSSGKAHNASFTQGGGRVGVVSIFSNCLIQ